MLSFSHRISLLSVILFISLTDPSHAELKPAAQTPFQQGLDAAQRQEWKAAIQNFLDAQQADPRAPQVLFNLGLASSKLPGCELRAIAWFQAYLIAAPGAPNTGAVLEEMRRLETTFEARIESILAVLEKGPNIHRAGEDLRYGIARTRLFLGKSDQATLSAYHPQWDFYTLSAAGRFDLAKAQLAAMRKVDLMIYPYRGQQFDFFLEKGDLDTVVQALPKGEESIGNSSSDLDQIDSHFYAWTALACAAWERHNSQIYVQSLDRATKLRDLFIKIAQSNIATSLGQIDYKLAIGENMQFLSFLVDLGEEKRAQAFAAGFPGGTDALKDRSKLHWDGPGCFTAAWWPEHGRFAFLIRIARQGVSVNPPIFPPTDGPNSGNLNGGKDMSADDTQLADVLQNAGRAYVGLSQDEYFENASHDLEATVGEISNLAEDYRKVRGPYNTISH